MKDAIANVLNFFLDMIFGFAYGIADNLSVTFEGNFSGIWTFITNAANNVIEPIAAIIVLTFFILSMMDKVTSENFTLEHALKEIMKLCIGLYLVTNAIEIVVMLIEMGNGILSSLMANNNAVVQWTQIKGSDLSTGNVFALLAVVVIMLLVGIVQLIIFLLMKLVVLSRVLDIALRTAMSPLALSDAFNGNFLNSNAMNFIRSFLAVCLQGSLIFILAYFTPTLITGALALDPAGGIDAWKICGAMCESIVVSGASLLIMFKSGSIAKEVLGAR